MPLYEIECETCGPQEIVRPIAEAPGDRAECPRCGKQCDRKWNVRTGLRPFVSYWTEALSQGEKPIRIDSREQELSLCKRFNFERVS